MFSLNITPDFLAYVLAAFVAVLFDWLPGLAAWFASQSDTRKRQAMIVILAGVTLAIYAGICGNVFITQFTCDKPGFAALVQVFILSIAINQSVHTLFKPGKDDPITWREAYEDNIGGEA